MRTAKKLIAGTPLETAARKALRTFRGGQPPNRSSERTFRAHRDEANLGRLMTTVLRPDSNCVDVGAHKGTFLKHVLDLAPDGQHFAFEPIPKLAEELSKEFPQVKVFNHALGNETGQVAFQYVQNLPAWSGFKTQHYPVKTEVDTIKVDVRRLDDALPQKLPIRLLKVDVEGAEYEVLSGAEGIIRRDKPCILFEHALLHTCEYGTTSEMMFELLARRYGLGIHCLDRRGPLTETEFIDICRSSHESNYSKHAQTNFVAMHIVIP